MFSSSSSSPTDNQRSNGNRDDGLDGLNIRRAPIHNGSTQQDKFKNERIFHRKRSYVMNEQLTYKIVIERIVKRFLLYYKNKHIGLEETNDGLEFKEFKNDISSLRFELLNEVDMLDDMGVSLLESMKKLHDDVHFNFDIEQMKQYLNNQSD